MIQGARTGRIKGNSPAAIDDILAPLWRNRPRTLDGDEGYRDVPAFLPLCVARTAYRSMGAVRRSQDPQLGLLGDAVAQEIILKLSRLHWLFVITRGSSFQFRGQEVDLARASHILGASYFLAGTIMKEGRHCAIALELCRVQDNTVIWVDRFSTPAQEIMHMRSTVAGKIVAALESRIQLSEALQAAKIPTEHLDAWAAYHRGLWRMYRFNKRDNELAAHVFTHAVKVDPGFARAHEDCHLHTFKMLFSGFRATPRQRPARRACMPLMAWKSTPSIRSSISPWAGRSG